MWVFGVPNLRVTRPITAVVAANEKLPVAEKHMIVASGAHY
jgi:hypothetical protein